jgi:DNA-binding response OmpR family regulator
MVKNVLIVDDEVSFLLSLKDGLKAYQKTFKVFTAENGREAVAILNEKPIDLLVTDLKLPEMDGFELLAWSSRHKPRLPVIVMSAFGTPEIEARLADMDTLEFLDKPLDLETLEKGIMKGLKAGNRSFINGISLATFLQLVKVENKNCTLKVSSAEDKLPAYLYIRNGELIDADCGALHGRDAAFEVVTWDQPEIEMDGICRRQSDIIKMPMEQLLMEAYRLKDERDQPVEDAVPTDVTPVSAKPAKKTGGHADDLELKQFVELMKKHSEIQEYVVFSGQNQMLFRQPSSCALQHFDLNSIGSLVDRLTDVLCYQGWRSLVLNSSARERYLLFYCSGYRVVSKLKSGAQAHKIAANVVGSII